MSQFPLVAQLIESTHNEVEKFNCVETLWGRREFFYKVEADGDRILASQKRKAFNFKIQSYVAELLRLALINLREFRRQHNMRYKIVLTVHDSIMLEVPIPEVEQVSEIVIPECMTVRAPAPRLGFTVGTDVDVSQRWDVKLLLDDFLDMGFSEEYGLKYCKRDKKKNPVRR